MAHLLPAQESAPLVEVLSVITVTAGGPRNADPPPVPGSKLRAVHGPLSTVYSYLSASAGKILAADVDGYSVASSETPSDSAVTITP